MAETLIIKRISNDFDKYVARQLFYELNNVIVKDVFRFGGRIGRCILKVLKQSESETLFGLSLLVTKEELAKFTTIILFDDYPDIKLLQYLRKNTNNCDIKLWFWNVPNYDIEKYRKYCSMYCFDQKFCKEHSIKYIDQFYFPSVALTSDYPITNDVVFVGIDKNRNKLLSEIADKFDLVNINYQFRLIAAESTTDARIEYEKEPLKYSEVVDICLSSKAILELVTDNQRGLTWRALEALFFHKKLITNNKSIIDFDFYNRNNIFIYGQDNICTLREFIDQPFVEIDDKITEKYTVQCWYKRIMED